MKKVIVIFIVLSLILSWVLTTNRLKSLFRPNIVMIIIDTLRADKLGTYGFPKGTSPEIDRLAKDGVVFKRVIAQSSWTRPSIGSMLTSLYPRTIGIYKEPFDILNDRFLTLAEILKDNGYTTIGITANPNINSVFNFNQGFDYYVDSNVVWRFMRPERGQSLYSEETNPLPTSGKIFNRLLEMVKSLREKRLFFTLWPVYMQINIMEVHQGWLLIRPEYKKTFPESNFSWYLDAIRQVSSDINRFIIELRSMPGWRNTLFIITSDHGQGLNDHPDVSESDGHGNLLYESQLLVPLILYHPGGNLKGRIIERPVRLIDLMPTVLDYLGIQLPKGIQGRSLLRIIEGEESDVNLPQYFVAETNWRNVEKIALYSDRWKYIENRDNWDGVNRYELQPMGIKENGIKTDRIEYEPGIAEEMKGFLRAWEKAHPKTPPTLLEHNPSLEEIRQLRSLGYLN